MNLVVTVRLGILIDVVTHQLVSSFFKSNKPTLTNPQISVIIILHIYDFAWEALGSSGNCFSGAFFLSMKILTHFACFVKLFLIFYRNIEI